MITFIIMALIGLFFLFVILAIPLAIIQNVRTPKTNCPYCENQVKLVTKTQKCPSCKTKLYKHGDGTYKIKA